MQDKTGQEFDAFVSSVTSFGIFVQLPNTIEGLIKMGDLDDDYYIFDEQNLTITGRHTGKTYYIGEKIKVSLSKVNADLKQIDFVPSDMTPKKKEVKKRREGTSRKKTERKHKGRRSKQKGKA